MAETYPEKVPGGVSHEAGIELLGEGPHVIARPGQDRLEVVDLAAKDPFDDFERLWFDAGG
jgi:hypothetical protein